MNWRDKEFKTINSYPQAGSLINPDSDSINLFSLKLVIRINGEGAMQKINQKPQFQLPCDYYVAGPNEKEIIQVFLNGLQHTDHEICIEKRILSAIYRTADLTDNSDAFVSKILAENGLKANRSAFPQDFLAYIDKMIIKPRQFSHFNISEKLYGLIDLWNTHYNDDPTFTTDKTIMRDTDVSHYLVSS